MRPAPTISCCDRPSTVSCSGFTCFSRVEESRGDTASEAHGADRRQHPPGEQEGQRIGDPAPRLTRGEAVASQAGPAADRENTQAACPASRPGTLTPASSL